MLSNEMRRDDRGVDRCARTVTHAVPNVQGDDSKGYHNVSGPCGMPIVQRISDGVRGCPRCDKEPSVGNIHPKVTNSAGVTLTPAELKECGLTVDTAAVQRDSAPVPRKRGRPKKMSEAVEESALRLERAPESKNTLHLKLGLEFLERQDDLPAALLQLILSEMDTLPVANFKESKRLMKLQEKIESLLEA